MNSDLNNLIAFGWNSYFENHFQQYDDGKLKPARIVLEHKGIFQLQTEFGELPASMTGRLRYETLTREDRPAVGDWVAAQIRLPERTATINAVLPRRSKFTRKVAGQRTAPQVVGANIDIVFLVMSLNNDYNLRRL